MENELLAFEVGFLKARLAEAERSAVHLEAQLAKAEGSSMSPQRRARLEGAERDLVSLLRSMSGSPFGRLFRLKEGFRTLEQRYL